LVVNCSGVRFTVIFATPHAGFHAALTLRGSNMRDAQSMHKVARISRRWVLLAVLVGLLAQAVGPASIAQTPQPPATILLIRHAEKLTDGRMDLSPVGFERAKLLPQLFGGPTTAAPHNLPRPDFLFATHVSKKSNRPVETITPLSQALQLPISSDFADDDFASLAKLLLGGGFAGKVVLVAWHHGKLPEFAAALGVGPQPPRWPDTQFDRVWRIDYRDGLATLTDLPQELLPGDSK
jgi:hypothetical protein